MAHGRAVRRGLGDEACTSAEMVELGGLLRRAAEAATEDSLDGRGRLDRPVDRTGVELGT